MARIIFESNHKSSAEQVESMSFNGIFFRVNVYLFVKTGKKRVSECMEK